MDQLVTRIPVPNGEIRIVIQEFRGESKLHIRRYYQDELERWLPTKMGVALDAEQAVLVMDAIGLGLDALRKR